MTRTSEPPALHILLVEDNPSDVFLLRTALHKSGTPFELRVVEDGEQALGVIEELRNDRGSARPDVILLDLNLPRCGGMDVLRALRKCSALAEVPVAIYTSSNAPHDRSAAAQLGARQYILKPSQLAELAHIVATIKELGSSAARGEREAVA